MNILIVMSLGAMFLGVLLYLIISNNQEIN